MKILSWSERYAPLTARILMGGMFLMAGIMKAMDPAGTAGYIASVGLPLPMALALLTIVLEIGAGFFLVAGYQTRYAAAALAVFTIFATALFHTNWAMPMQQMFFTKNLSIIADLLYMMTYGSGMFAKDSK